MFDDTEKENLTEMNEVRAKIYDLFAPLSEAFTQGKTVRDETTVLYELIEKLEIEQKLKQKELEFERQGNQVKAKEYAQIYKIVMDLFDKVVDFLGGEVLPVKEYADILDAGFEAARVGVIPPGNDKVTIGDIERTRLNHIKILFFIGVNDGVVPKRAMPEVSSRSLNVRKWWHVIWNLHRVRVKKCSSNAFIYI